MVILNEFSSIKEWGNLFLYKKQGEVSIGHFKSLQSNINHINIFFGNRTINSVRALEIDEFLKSPRLVSFITGRQLSKKTLTSIRNTFISIYDFANENEVFIHNPARGRKIPRKAPQTKRWPLHDYEIDLVENSEGTRMYLSALILLHTGVRRGELIPFEWTWFDLNKCVIKINQSVYQDGNRFIVQDCLKTDAGERIVRFPARMCEIIKKERLKSNSKYVCCKKDGSLHTPTSWKSAWQSYLNQLNFMYWNAEDKYSDTNKYNPKGYPKSIHITPHMFRHTYATMLYISGTELLDMKYLLGHSDIKTTLQIYTHIQNSLREVDISKYEKYIESKGYLTRRNIKYTSDEVKFGDCNI